MQTADTLFRGSKKWWDRYTVLPVIAVILLIYFDTFNHYWFINLLGGYVLKVWLLPFLVFFVFLLRRLIKGDLHYPTEGIHHLNAVIAAYIFAGFASLFVHETPWNIGKYALIMFGPVLLYYAIVYGLRDNREIERVLKLLFLLGLIYSAYSLYLFYFIGPEAWSFAAVEKKFMLSDKQGVVSDPYAFTSFFSNEEQGTIIRVAPPGIDEPRFGGMLAPLVLVGFYFASRSQSYLKVFYFLSSFLLIFSVMATLARSSIAALFAGLVIFFVSSKNKMQGLLFGLAVLVTTVVIMMSMGGVMDRFIQLAANISFLGKTEIVKDLIFERNVYMSEEGHVTSYKEGFNIIKKAPLYGILGIGIENFEEMFRTYRWGVPHSRYVFILDTTGFLTLLPYVGFIVMLIFTSRKNMLRQFSASKQYNLGNILYPAAFLFAVKLNNEGMETYYYWIFFALAAAWIRNSAYEENNEHTLN